MLKECELLKIFINIYSLSVNDLLWDILFLFELEVVGLVLVFLYLSVFLFLGRFKIGVLVFLLMKSNISLVLIWRVFLM